MIRLCFHSNVMVILPGNKINRFLEIIGLSIIYFRNCMLNSGKSICVETHKLMFFIHILFVLRSFFSHVSQGKNKTKEHSVD